MKQIIIMGAIALISILATFLTWDSTSKQQTFSKESFDKQTTIVKLIIKQAILDGYDYSKLHIKNKAF